MLRALREYEIGGLTTLIPFHRALLATEQWARGETCRDLLEDPEWLKSPAPAAEQAPAGGGGGREGLEHAYTVEVSGRRFEVSRHRPARRPAAAAGGRQRRARRRGAPPGAAGAAARAGPRAAPAARTRSPPAAGQPLKVLVKQGDRSRRVSCCASSRR